MLGVGLIALVGLVGANAFFVLSEFALITVDRGRLEQQAEAGDPRARALLNATAQLTRHLSAAQFGITLSSLLIGSLPGIYIGSHFAARSGQDPATCIIPTSGDLQMW